MLDSDPTSKKRISLKTLMQRGDVWVGNAKPISYKTHFSSQYEMLDRQLIHGGWPQRALIEVCQNGYQAEWQLFLPSLLSSQGFIALLNPPAQPFCQAFIQADVDLDKVVIIDAAQKNLFLQAYIELLRANAGSVIAWQPTEGLTYTDLRRCSLAAQGNDHLSIILRPSKTQQSSSPAALRLFTQVTAKGLSVSIFKQKGHLKTPCPGPIDIPLPEKWKLVARHADLPLSGEDAEPNKSAAHSVLPFEKR